MNLKLTNSQYAKMVAETRSYEGAKISPCEHANEISVNGRFDVYLKREDLQDIRSFKIRGAVNKLYSMDDESLSNGVICSSAGNHAQGVAKAAQMRGVPVCVVMPESTPEIKVGAVKSLGATVVLHGATYDDAQREAIARSERDSMAFIAPFDDPHVIAGQGTIASELLRQVPDHIDAVVVPIGGGGLAAGVATYLAHHSPSTKVYGVEPANSASMTAALAAGGPVELDSVGAFSDGVAVKTVGNETYRKCSENLAGIVTVTTDETCAAIAAIFEQTRSIVEPAGALAVAGLEKLTELPDGATVVAICSGANMNFDRLRHIAERATLGAGREALFAVSIPEAKGSFLEFVSTLEDYHITEFNYRQNSDTDDDAYIFVGIGTDGTPTAQSKLLATIRDSDYEAHDLTDDELAILHIRHLAAGSGRAPRAERLYRFLFPERKGALADFLRAIGVQWDISLFHYRNHGSDYGRVLCGVKVEDSSLAAFKDHLDSLGFPHWDESDNLSYQLFLNG